eukprot:SAG22_NODE_3645_length_1597_cov_1.512016_1_plen_240_part_10
MDPRPPDLNTPHYRAAGGRPASRPQPRVDMNGGQPTTGRGGGFHGSLSYFSLDLFVEAIEEAAVSCKVPAMSFEFMQFPAIKIFSAAAGPVESRGALRAEFEQGTSCVFEAAEHELQAALRTTAVLRLSWVDMWQLRERELGACAIRMDAGLNRIVEGKPAHFQQGRHPLLDRAGMVIGFVRLELSLVCHGPHLVPELLRQRDYKVAPKSGGHGGHDAAGAEWEPVLKRLVAEHRRQGGG